MVYLKTYQEINLMRESAMLVSRTHAELAKIIKPGITSLHLDKIAEEFIRDNGGLPGFKGYNGFPSTLCISQDNEVVHGIPSKRAIKEGSILSIDCGVLIVFMVMRHILLLLERYQKLRKNYYMLLSKH